ncbi:hypothetical protein VKT23_019413 [Stygiomarasmius scandens]|uniref:Uncharacterized protein n=1 Tax=Marasmiellus scandens TaxID=2682957 RepID=A0ABR1ILM8_9AGAR
MVVGRLKGMQIISGIGKHAGFDKAINFKKNQLKEHKLTEMEFPTDFLKFPRCQANVRAHTEANYTTNPNAFSPLSLHGNVVFSGRDHDEEFIVARFNNVINPVAGKLIWKAYLSAQALGVKFPRNTDKSRSEKDSQGAIHVGYWKISRKSMGLTADTVNQTPEAIKALDELNMLIKKYLLPAMRRILEEYFPEDLERRMHAHKQVSEELADEFAARPALDFEGIFTTYALKEGGSTRIHLDRNDAKKSRTFVFCCGDYHGGEFVTPQVQLKVATSDRQLLCANTKQLSHCCAPFTGRRLGLTFFCEHSLMKCTGALD